jgi:UDP-N-acetylglucosamine 2-epimerase (non-hydrolysing)
VTCLKVLVAFGTRPEAIKLAPVIHRLAAEPDRFETVVCVTGQHREMLDQVLAFFDVRPARDLRLMRPDQTLPELTAAVLVAMGDVLAAERPDLALVQGDTTTTMATALAAFYARTPVAHVEAGLRTRDRFAPFPEEVNRRIVSTIADLHFAPTVRARDALLGEGVDPAGVHVTGNTVVDALLAARARLGATAPSEALRRLAGDPRPLVLVTAHRRESFGPGLRDVCLAVRDLVERNPELLVVFPVHLNPRVREPVEALLRASAACGTRLLLTGPVDYPDLVWLLDRCRLVLTDSGGIQEEAPTFAKPVLVLRGTTERPEGVDAGVARVVGTNPARIVAETERLLHDPAAYAAMAAGGNPYGDGRAAERIVDVLRARVTPG